MRGLEERLGIRLLMRTTRSVSPTNAGERLIRTIGPCFEDIQSELTALNELRDKPAGTIRLSSSSHAADYILIPKLQPFLKEYPDIQVEINVDNGLTDIVSERFDAGVRLGERVAKDMIATCIGPNMRMVVVAAPDYFEHYSQPKDPHELTEHNCINFRFPTHGGLYMWEFEKKGHAMNVSTEGQLIVNNTQQQINATLAGVGLGFVPEDMVEEYIKSGQLIQVLDDWCPYFPGFHLYYPNRRQPSPAFSLLLEALRSSS